MWVIISLRNCCLILTLKTFFLKFKNRNRGTRPVLRLLLDMNCLSKKMIVDMNGLFIKQIMLVLFFYMAIVLANPINARTISACTLKPVDNNWTNITSLISNHKRFTFPFNKGSSNSVVLISEGYRFVNFSKVDKSFKNQITKINF